MKSGRGQVVLGVQLPRRLSRQNGEAGGVRFAGCTDRAFAFAGMDGLEGDGFTFHVSLLEPATPPVIGIQSLTLSKSATAGCQSVTGTIALTGPLLRAGCQLHWQDNLASASMTSTVDGAGGSHLQDVHNQDAGSCIRGSRNGQRDTCWPDGQPESQCAPNGPLLRDTFTDDGGRGKPVAGTAKLVCKSGPGPITVELTSSNPGVANPVATSIVIPQGLQSAPFTVTTNQVLSKSSAVISGTANATTKSKTLTVTTVASISPTSLKFGNQAVGTTRLSRQLP